METRQTERMPREVLTAQLAALEEIRGNCIASKEWGRALEASQLIISCVLAMQDMGACRADGAAE